MSAATMPVDGTAGVLASLKTWATSPFSETMDLQHWFLWTGLVIVMVVAWTMILRDLDKAV